MKMSAVESGDVRKAFLLTTIANHFSLPVGHESIAGLADSPKLNTFLDDGNAPLLSANVEGGAGDGRHRRIMLDNAAHVGHTDDKAGLRIIPFLHWLIVGI